MGLSGPKKNANRCACWHYKPEPAASEGAWPPAGSLGKKEHRGRHSSTRDKWLRSHRYIVLVQNQRPRLGPKETRVYVARSVATYITDPSGTHLPGELSGKRPTPRTAGRCKADPPELVVTHKLPELGPATDGRRGKARRRTLYTRAETDCGLSEATSYD